MVFLVAAGRCLPACDARANGVPGCAACARYCASSACESSLLLPDSSHTSLSARRPCSAAQVPVATTATPSGTCTTSVTPLIFFASPASNDTSLAPNDGGQATTAVNRPGSLRSIV